MKQNINELEINGIIYVKKGTENVIAKNVDGLKPVLIRSYASGVHYGYLQDEKFTESGKVVTLINSRRIHYWSGACSCSQLALEGVKNDDICRISVVVPEIEIVNVVETIPLTDTALSVLDGVSVWKS